jgi:2'-hydroxyisoflavone reductase
MAESMSWLLRVTVSTGQPRMREHAATVCWMRILIMGGTAFVGRHIAVAALDRGHEVSLFHRGQTGAALFPEAVHLTGDRNQTLDALQSGEWDATIDVSAYVPRQVRSLAAELDGRGGHYLFISSASAYRTPVRPGFSENAPLNELADPQTEEITADTYGGLKVACERTAAELFGPGTTIVRPTYVIGPHDRSYRFTWWVERLARGGQVLAPGDPADPIQVIDARDLATWTVSLLERDIAGAFHAASPPPPFGFGQLLETIAARVAPAGTTLTWVDSDFLAAAGQDDTSLPLWPAADTESDINAADPANAYAAGLAPRPLGDSVTEVHVAEQAAPTPKPAGIGLTDEQEADLLARWAAKN